LGTFWLKIEQFWSFEKKSIFSSGGLLGFRTAIKPNLAVMVPVWVPFKNMSDRYALHPRWPPLLKIEISSNDQNCKKNLFLVVVAFLDSGRR
jgi:hypothetical protein